MKIVIDARESGTSSGRYVDKLIEYLHTLPTSHQFILLHKRTRHDYLSQIAPRFRLVETPYKEFTFGEQIGFLRQINRLDADLVHFPFVQQPVLYRGRVVTTMQDLTTLRFRNPTKNFLVFTLKQQVYKLVNKHAARKSAKVITPTTFVKNDVAQYTGIPLDKIVVTLEAADKITVPATPVTGLEKTRFIMYVGRPMPHKNLPRLIEAFVILQKKYPELRLVLAGKTDSLFEQIANTTYAQGLQNITFTGFVSESELRWLYEHTAAYVFPSLSEGFGLPGLEAAMHGAPVVSSNATCLPEVHKDGALYFDPLRVEDIAQKIDLVLSDKRLAAELVQKGQAVAKSYSWKRMAEQTLGVYESVLSPSGSTS